MFLFDSSIFSFILFLDLGYAPHFRRAVENGDIVIRDATCPALYAELQASEKGTPFMPSLENSILFIEDDDIVGDLTPVEFDRNFQSILHLPDFSGVRGIVLGRFPKSCKMSDEAVKEIMLSKDELKNIPMIFNLDFSHTTPMFTFPIGGEAILDVDLNGYTLKIISY